MFDLELFDGAQVHAGKFRLRRWQSSHGSAPIFIVVLLDPHTEGLVTSHGESLVGKVGDIPGFINSLVMVVFPERPSDVLEHYANHDSLLMRDTYTTGAVPSRIEEEKVSSDAVEQLEMLSVSLYTVQSSSSEGSKVGAALLPLARGSCMGTMMMSTPMSGIDQTT